MVESLRNTVECAPSNLHRCTSPQPTITQNQVTRNVNKHLCQCFYTVSSNKQLAVCLRNVMFMLHRFAYIHPWSLHMLSNHTGFVCVAIIPGMPSIQRLAVIKHAINFKWLYPLKC